MLFYVGIHSSIIFQPPLYTFFVIKLIKQTKMRTVNCDRLWLHCNFRYSLIHTFSILVPHQLFPLSHFLWFSLLWWWYVKWHPFFPLANFVGHSSKHSRGYGEKNAEKIRHKDENGYFFREPYIFSCSAKKFFCSVVLDIKQKMLHNVWKLPKKKSHIATLRAKWATIAMLKLNPNFSKIKHLKHWICGN